MTAIKLFDAVQQSKCINDELKALKTLVEYLFHRIQSTGDQNAFDDDHYLHDVSLDSSSMPESFFTQQDILNRFVCYVFVRRFGWSEASDNGVRPGHGVTDPEHKSQINEILEHILLW